MQVIRHIASRDRHRYQKHDYDLDLTYILPNIIAMAFPGESYEKIYSNNIEDVAEFLDERHGRHYHVYNLCAERGYPSRYFHHRVTRYRIDDFNPAPVEMMREFCEDVHGWLSRDPRNVVAVHCHAGKGRTGTMISAYLLYKRMFSTPEQAIEFFHSKRMKPGTSAMRPSQHRYVRYFARLIRERFVYSPRPLALLAIEFSECPAVNGFLCSPSFTVKQQGAATYKSRVFTANSRRPLMMELQRPLRVAGDIKITFFDKHGAGKMLLFWTWLNTYFVGSSSSAPSVGCPVYAGLASDEWRPVPSRAGARHDGSGAGPRCYVSMVGVGEDGDATGGPGRRITVSLPRLELDRYTSDIDDIVRPEFTVKLYLGTLPDGA